MLPFVIIAIDGGAASGKSSTARELSKRFNLLHVDTGSFYRAVAAELLRRGLAPGDLPAIRAALPAMKLGARIDGRAAFIEIDGRPVAAGEIRTAAVNDNVALFAKIPEVRAALLDYQRGFAATARDGAFRGLVMEGRDIGSKIFPNADFRFILHADSACRASRREKEGQQDQIAKRDDLDLQRVREGAAGATVIDSTHMNLDQVVDAMADIIAGKTGQPDATAK